VASVIILIFAFIIIIIIIKNVHDYSDTITKMVQGHFIKSQG